MNGSSPPATFTGRHMLIITLGGFGVVIAVNLLMAILATVTFPGLIARNGYVASQTFNAEQAAARERQALGWHDALELSAERVALVVRDAAGRPVEDLTVTAMIGRPTSDRHDRMVVLAPQGDGYAAELALAPGRWQVAIDGRDRQGTLVFARRQDFFLNER